MGASSPRSLDHIVLPVEDLDRAQTRLRALGFTVSPVGRHPFGTSNCCVYIADGTFLEPLAVTDQASADKAVAAGNVFVARDRQYRQVSGENGLSAVVLASGDARSDHARFRKAGISAGDLLEFSRPFVDSTGRSDGATFRLAFAAEETSPEPFFFTCQRVRSPRVNRTALQEHRNGATRVAEIVFSSADPERHRSFLGLFLDAEPSRADPDKLVFDLSNASVSVTRDEAAGHGMRASAIRLLMNDTTAKLRSILRADRIEHRASGGSVIVPPAPGQGVTFIFESET